MNGLFFFFIRKRTRDEFCVGIVPLMHDLSLFIWVRRGGATTIGSLVAARDRQHGGAPWFSGVAPDCLHVESAAVQRLLGVATSAIFDRRLHLLCCAFHHQSASAFEAHITGCAPELRTFKLVNGPRHTVDGQANPKRHIYSQ
jgi:hypothetical protein